MVIRLRDSAGITLIEILIATALLGAVFTAAISMYASGIKALKQRQAVDISVSPEVSLEGVTRKIAVAFEADINPAPQLNIRLDQTCGGADLATPSNAADDVWWHFRFKSNALLALCDNSQATVLTNPGSPAGTIELISNVDTSGPGSDMTITNPSGSGSASVVHIHLVSTNPVLTVDTETALGAKSKR